MKRLLGALLIVILVLAVIPYAPLHAAQEQATETPTETPTETATPTITLTPSATTAGAYVYQLSSGKTFIIDPEITFGEIVRGGLLIALLLTIIVYAIYQVVVRWA